jgi:hypothetical protein
MTTTLARFCILLKLNAKKVIKHSSGKQQSSKFCKFARRNWRKVERSFRVCGIMMDANIMILLRLARSVNCSLQVKYL